MGSARANSHLGFQAVIRISIFWIIVDIMKLSSSVCYLPAVYADFYLDDILSIVLGILIPYTQLLTWLSYQTVRYFCDVICAIHWRVVHEASPSSLEAFLALRSSVDHTHNKGM